jgi:hypothetical protein
MVPLAVQTFLANARFLGQSEVSLWFVFWALRHRYELDDRLDNRSSGIRWLIVVSCFAVGCVPGPRFGIIKAIVLLFGLAFLCWPNLARSFNSVDAETSG